jgi:biopolymer transport protein ExbD
VARIAPGISLPASTSEITAPTLLKGVVSIHDGQVFIDGVAVGAANAEGAVEAVTKRLLRQPDKDDRFARLVLVEPGKTEDPNKPSWNIVLLAVDPGTRFEEVAPLLAGLADRGARKLKLMVQGNSKDGKPDSPEELRRRLRKAHGDLGVLEDIMSHEQYPYNVINAWIVPDWVAGEADDGTSRKPLRLTMAVHDGRWAVGKVELPDSSYSTDNLDDLLTTLKEIKDEHPEERDLYVLPSGATTIGELVAILDVARETGTDDQPRVLFDAVHILTKQPGTPQPRWP